MLLSRAIAASVGACPESSGVGRRRQRRARFRRAAGARAARAAAAQRLRLRDRAAHRRARRARRSGASFVERVVRETNALAPDMVVITGDLVDGSVEQLRELVEPLARAARDGRRLLRDRQPRVLLGRRRVDRAPRDARHPRPAQRARRHPRRVRSRRRRRRAARAAWRRATGRTSRARSPGATRPAPSCCSLTSPSAARRASPPASTSSSRGTCTAASWCPSTGWRASISRCVAGLHLVEQTWVYVSTGTGYWGPPMRVGPGAELTRIELVVA